MYHPPSGRQRYYNLQIPPAQRLEVRELFLSQQQEDRLQANLHLFPNLQILSVIDSQLEQFPEAILQLPLLEELILKNNQISLIPAQIYRLNSLKKLNLSGNNLHTWPEALSAMPQLQQLDLSGNALSEIPKSFKELKNLERLQLADNQITNMPREIGHLQQLKELNLEGNQIKRLPRSMEKCRQLEVCRLSKNRLTSLPDMMESWSNLNILDVRENRLKSLPQTLQNCPTLQRLLVAKNRCKTIPNFISGFSWLKVLDFSHNGIEKINKQLAGCLALDQLDLSNNSLSHLPDLDKMSQLERLNLAGNQLTELPTLPTRLKYLDLSRNRLSQWPNALTHLSRLRALSLEYNRIDQLPTTFGRLNDSLQSLKLKNNPVKCPAKKLIPLDQLQDLSGLMPVRKFENLLQFKQVAKTIKLPKELHPAFFALFQGKEKELLATFDSEKWQYALNFYLGPVHDLCREYLLKRFSHPISKKNIQQICLAGHTAFDSQSLAQRLQAQGIGYSTEPQAATSHILLGFPIPGKIAFTFPIPIQGVALINEKRLNHFLNKQEKRYLWSHPQEEQVEALDKLLLHPDAANVRLAIQMLHGGGVPDNLRETLFAAYLIRTEPDLKTALKQFLAVNMKDKGKQLLLQNQLYKPSILNGHLSPNERSFFNRNGLSFDKIVRLLNTTF
ncbi:MAG: hypothetical protein DHS20C18_11340 [Saprospiraceae bacterium]|nr:MAG: hypothetical protein DHS20C18_11340 [Saprospiraceae bacterium]